MSGGDWVSKSITRILCIFVVLMSIVVCVSCSDNKNAVIEYRDKNGKVTSGLDQSFMSLWIAVQNYQYSTYISAFDSLEGYNTVIDKQSGKTLDEVMLDEAVRTAGEMLKAEYIHDNVYNISFSKEQQDSVDMYIDALVANIGSKKALESALSKYGTSISALERYLVLSAKYQTLYNTLYSEGGVNEITDDMKKQYFAENYSVADHILFDVRGKQKEDGTVIPLTEEEILSKKTKAEEVYAAILSQVYTFDEAKEMFNEDAYSKQYPFGYFVTDDGTFWEEFESAALEMQENEIRLVKTNAGYHIILKKPMNTELYKSNGDFSDSLEILISQDSFSMLLDDAKDGVVINDNEISKFKPSLIKPFGFDEFFAE